MIFGRTHRCTPTTAVQNNTQPKIYKQKKCPGLLLQPEAQLTNLHLYFKFIT